MDYGLVWSDMLKLTKKADYGLIALRHLALHQNGASAKEIAALYGIPTPLLAKVLQKLARTGLLTAAHGSACGSEAPVRGRNVRFPSYTKFAT